MKSFILLLVGVVAALLIVGGAMAYNIIGDASGDDSGDESSVSDVIDKVSNIASSDNSEDSSDDDSSEDSDIVSEEVKFNAQNGEGYYREVTYKDGGFRQYDSESGDLIGSSYDSDQDQLPSME